MSRIVRAVSAGDVSGASGIDPLPDGQSGAGLYAIKQASRIRPTSTISRFSKLQVKAGSAAGRRPRTIHHAIFSRTAEAQGLDHLRLDRRDVLVGLIGTKRRPPKRRAAKRASQTSPVLSMSWWPRSGDLETRS